MSSTKTSSKHPSSSSKMKHTTASDYEEYKKRVIEEDRMKKRRRSEIPHTTTTQEPNFVEARNENVTNWLSSNGKTHKQQHYEKTVNEIDRIMGELKDKGVEAPKEVKRIPKLITTPVANEGGLKGILKDSESSSSLHAALEKERLLREQNGPGDMFETDPNNPTFQEMAEDVNNLSLNDPKKKWNEANKTRYVRAKEPRNIEIVLSNEEIFDKRSPMDKDNAGWWKSYCQQAPQKGVPQGHSQQDLNGESGNSGKLQAMSRGGLRRQSMM